MKSVLHRAVAAVGRVSARLYGLLVVLLLAGVYALVLPWFALGWRFRRRRLGGWHHRATRDVTTVERLRAPF